MDFAKFASRMGWDLDDHFPWKELAYTDDKGNKVVLVNVDGKQMVRTPAGGYISQEQFHAMTHPLHEPIPPEVAIAASMKEAISSKVSVVQLVPTSKPKPDWETWGSIPDTSIINAVALSCNVEPNTLANEFVGAGADPTSELHQFWKRLLIASANAINGALKRVRSNPGTTLLPPCIFDDVSLIELSTWAEGLPYPWELPAGFPRSSGPRKQAPPAGPPVQQPTAATVGITVSLPHTTTDLEAVFKVMRECWADSNIPPMQKDVAAALDKAIGRWNVPKGKAVSRESEIVASLICHDSHKRARKRDDI